MKSILLTNKGIEDVAALEIKEIIGKKSEIEPFAVKFDCSKKELCKLCYKSQSARRIIALLAEFKTEKDLKPTTQNIKKNFPDLEKWLINKSKFKVDCIRRGEHNFKSNQIAGEIGELILKKCESKNLDIQVDLDNPEVLFGIYIFGEKAYFGVDFGSIDLGKRDYKVLTYTPSLKSNIGFALLKLADYSEKKTMVDPITTSGIVPIEAALYALGRSVNYYQKDKLIFKNLLEDPDDFFKKQDLQQKKKIAQITCLADQFRHIKAAKANSKIAGINKSINFSKFEVEWLDVKFDKNSIEVIASNAPRVSKQSKKRVNKIYDELFYHANYILALSGVIALITNKTNLIKKNAKKHGFKVHHERSVWQGEEELKIVIIKRD
ncbi:MAG: tRNA (guanine(6)-N2)-methyltransferase [Candidatus Woesearchaeota archaeon]|nr:tRNA (guanine(6)-N2)-methyltransferase [Candidatus Woesearchaeota archaeon]